MANDAETTTDTRTPTGEQDGRAGGPGRPEPEPAGGDNARPPEASAQQAQRSVQATFE